ncbi:hypothetical protein PAECIP112173_01305 [Paenibacillus sp. JJ-100]|uniref:fibronectin type III domain-containing protein n=1 Tax=Paenibacillus sp. JJ-100 TaxID=2974896 RepID=UPI0022FF7C32|nr:fibronectin type III domain-containing protein [Paenibacillus sp. JJ-100]CAI6048732.1 hypothetical protein PAECIP112173_01305 [Paenibacillus sp. JJ-100]
MFQKKGTRLLSVLLCTTLITSMLSIGTKTAFAAAATPSLNAYHSGNHVKLEWGVTMQPPDILSQTSFESGQEIPNLHWSGIGNQSVVAAPGGGNALRVTDTMSNHTGNLINFPVTQSDWSVSQFKGKSLPGGSAISITFRAMATGGNFSQFYFTAATGWYKRGYNLTDTNGKFVKFGQTVDWRNPPDTIAAYVDGGIISLVDGDVVVMVSSRDQNYSYGVMLYQWDDTNKIFRKAPTNNAPWGQVLPNGQTFAFKNEIFNYGDQILRYNEGGVGFPVRQIASDGVWTTYSLNTVLPTNDEYDYMTYGIKPMLFWQTNGSLFVDDITFGYASQVNLYRDGEMIYSGYLSDFDDTTAVDLEGPKPVTLLNTVVSNRYPQITWSPSSGDNGTTYNYQIRAVAPSGSSPLSANKPVTVTSGVKGYSIVVDTHPTTVPDNTIETTGTIYSWPNQVSSNFYVHIAAVDNQGNISSIVHKQYTDTIAPSLSVTPSTTSWTSGNVTLTASGSDSETGIHSLQQPDGTWTEGGTASVVATDNGAYTFVAKDNAGNTKSQSYTITNIDKTAPAQPTLTLNPSGWSNNIVTATLTPGTDTQSGVKKSQYKIGNGAWTDYVGPFLVRTEGQNVISAQTIDNVGNVSTMATATASIDKTAPNVPTLTMSNATWTNQDVTFTIADGNDTGSGTAKSQYKVGTGGVWTDYVGAVSLSQEGVTDIYARSVDRVGNESSTVQGTARIDKTPPSDPSITLSDSTWTPTPVTFNIGGSKDVNSVSYEYKLNDGAYTVGTSGTVTAKGKTTLTVRAKDAVGNESNEITRTIWIDNAAPTITITPNAQDWTANDVPVTIAYADTESDINPNKRFYKLTSSAETPSSWNAATSDNLSMTIQEEGTWYVHAKAEDYAGNTFDTVSQAIRLQRSASIPGNVRVTQVTEKTAQVAFDLPESVYPDGYSYDVTNETTGQTWTLQHPNHTITDTALEGGRVYTYTVRASNHVGQSAKSAPVTALTLPKAPENIHIDVVGTHYGIAAVSFDPVESATGYRIVVKETGHTEVYNQSVTDTVYQPIGNLSSGTLYHISVSAINASGEGASKNVSFKSLPSAPGNFKTAQVGERDILLSWDTVTSATYYNLSRGGVPIYGGEPRTSYHDTLLEPGTFYPYELYAANETGVGGASQFSTITLPAQVTSLQVSSPTASTLSLHWDDMKGATQYVVDLNGQRYQTVPSDTTMLRVNGLTPGTPYTFEVHAENASGSGANATASGLTIPEQATGLHTTGTHETGTTLSWDPITGADQYRVTINGKTVEVAGTSYNVNDLEGSKTYSFSVEAGNASGYGEKAEASFLTAPYAPGNFQVTTTTEHTVGLKWDAVQTARFYEVSIDGQVVGNPTAPEFQAMDLEAGTTYELTVKAVNATGTSKATPVTWMTKPSAPTGVKSVLDAYKAEVTWDSMQGAVEYVIEDGSTVLYRGTDTKTTLTGLSDGTMYHYTVRSLNVNGISSEKTSFDLLTLPRKPVELGTTDIQTKQLTLDLSKTQVVGADQYLIERDGKRLASIATTKRAYTDKNLLPGTKYTYAVQAKNASGVGETATYVVTTKTLAVTGSGIKVMPETHAIGVTWNTVPGAVSYQIRNTVTDEVYSTSSSNAVLMNLPDGAKATFELIAINESGVESEATIFGAMTKPVAPATAKVSRVTDTTITLDLSGSAVRGATEFIIERDGKEIGRTAADQISFQDHRLSPGKTYTYVVKAANESGSSDEGFSVKVQTLPATVKSSAKPGEVTESSISISWQAAEGADGYRILIGNQVYTVTDQTSITIAGLESAKTYDTVRVVPYNEAGDGETIAVQKAETLPSGEFTVEAMAKSTHELEFKWILASPNEIFVLAKEGKEVYRGKDRYFVLGKLLASTDVAIQIWTENAGGAKSKVETVRGRTKAETFSPSSGSGTTTPKSVPTVPPNEPQPTLEPKSTPEPNPAKQVRFIDISSTFNKEQIMYLAQQGIVSGVSPTKFEPKRPITRAEFTALIVRMMGIQLEAYEGTFKDVHAEDWYAPYVGTGLSQKVITGMGQSIFAPNQNITREQASVILANVTKSIKGIRPEDSQIFTDHERISYWATEKVEYLSGLQMINGYEDGTFRPLNDLTRAEAAALIYRLKNFLEVK